MCAPRPTTSACRLPTDLSSGRYDFIICRRIRAIAAKHFQRSRLSRGKVLRVKRSNWWRGDSTVNLQLSAVCLGRAARTRGRLAARVNIVVGSRAETHTQQRVRRKPNKGAGGSYVKKMKSLVLEQWAMTCAPGSIHVLLPVTRRLIDSQPSCSVNVVYRVSSCAAVLCRRRRRRRLHRMPKVGKRANFIRNEALENAIKKK